MARMLGQLRAVVARLNGASSLAPLPLLQHNLTSPNLHQVRTAVGAFNSQGSDSLWKSITIVSKNGARRGRGKKTNSRLIKDLYKGVALGTGQGDNKMVWPGLNTSVLRGRQVVQQGKMEEKEDPNAAVKEAKDEVQSRRKLHPLDRGFTSVNVCGRNLKNTTNLNFHEDFDFRVIDSRNVSHMTGMFGRYQQAATVVACGNGNGVIGLGAGKALTRNSSIQKAANRAIIRLVHVERYNNSTVLHDFFSQYYATKIFVTRKPEGYGLNCHRVIALMCRLIGIKDLEATVEGSVMPMNIAKAFLLGLVQQKKYEQFAEEKKLHVVEFDPKRRNYPSVLASPEVCRSNVEIPTSESIDFNQHALGGKVRFEKPKRAPFFVRLKGWEIHLKRTERRRGAKTNEYELMAKYGELNSFLTAKYPEAVRPGATPKE
ncbi:28S ribosomal protein S5, mitochondrial [Thrips palmi]|uniref:Small ribosomal subunit protein uS5m n=1 Tax=Thrips palmi TaxID=161013 RepID=A0A6P8YHF9_THRPL|nr:28S ribosomal protein S5, mitochondrial [Thrips palmi]